MMTRRTLAPPPPIEVADFYHAFAPHAAAVEDTLARTSGAVEWPGRAIHEFFSESAWNRGRFARRDGLWLGYVLWSEDCEWLAVRRLAVLPTCAVAEVGHALVASLLAGRRPGFLATAVVPQDPARLPEHLVYASLGFRGQSWPDDTYRFTREVT
jgi:GNAT superfamily N-acetyltransferase